MNKRKLKLFLALLTIFLFFITACEEDEDDGGKKVEEDKELEYIEGELRAAHTDDEIALRLEWEGQKDYPEQFDNLIRYDGENWIPLEEDESEEVQKKEGKILEDRASIAFEDPESEVEGFEAAGCYVSCHQDMAGHYVKAKEEENKGEFGLDLWHWGAGTSSIDYAQDMWVSKEKFTKNQDGLKYDEPGEGLDEIEETLNLENLEDSSGFIKSQPLEGIRWDGEFLPRYVFNPDKVGFDNYFFGTEEGKLVTDPQELLESAKSMDYEPLKVIYQDYDFDPEIDRINTIDVKFIVELARGEIEPGFEVGESWQGYWMEKLNITTPEGAEEKLDRIVEELKPGAMLTKNTGIIYESGQHDVTTIREYDEVTNTWSITFQRNLSTETETEAGDEDVDFEGLLEDELYNLAIGIHEKNEQEDFHYVSFPIQAGTEEADAELIIEEVEEDLTIDTTDDVDKVDWSEVEPLELTFHLPQGKNYQKLTDKNYHGEGADFLKDEKKCKDCHGEKP